MAGMNPRRLKASTLPEALAAMAISAVCMGIGATIYFNVLQSDNGAQKLKVHLLLNKLAEESKLNRLFLNDEQKLQGLSIKKTIEAYPGSEKLFVLNFCALDESGKKLEEHTELIRKEENP